MPKPIRLKSLDDLDQRSSAFRRARSAMARIEADLGGSDNLTELQRQLIVRVATLSAMLESIEAAWLTGAKVDVPGYAATASHFRRLCEALGLARIPKFANANGRDLTPEILSAIRRAKRA